MEGHAGILPSSARPPTGTILWWRPSALRYEVMDCSTLKVISIEMTGDFYWLTNVLLAEAQSESFTYEFGCVYLRKFRL